MDAQVDTLALDWIGGMIMKRKKIPDNGFLSINGNDYSQYLINLNLLFNQPMREKIKSMWDSAANV